MVNNKLPFIPTILFTSVALSAAIAACDHVTARRKYHRALKKIPLRQLRTDVRHLSDLIHTNK